MVQIPQEEIISARDIKRKKEAMEWEEYEAIRTKRKEKERAEAEARGKIKVNTQLWYDENICKKPRPKKPSIFDFQSNGGSELPAPKNCKAKFKEMAKFCHPDKGGSTMAMSALNEINELFSPEKGYVDPRKDYEAAYKAWKSKHGYGDTMEVDIEEKVA